ncbi:MAG: substrate-binding domain-containing protein [Methylobacterium sp.]|jgi:LacI family transcriptional regulator|nr:substrate-binding domain-containing protein [Methylobacterium sp.]MCA3603419.1 substrate-binding domain-containing protein [Methylobacterium sp.]MCA3607276.1 substrate-binding domain-containing protein [Methylobacterium sp.]MCA3612845.1 substrate-binding domain-containing protein [Methylobacterium sp.]MCA3615104.1 substrate-binding domain-containing protein [Methylobacterium sp.]
MKFVSEANLAQRKTKLIDVARDAGVSAATASRAMSQPDLLNPETLERVLESARRLGYLPDGMARALVSGRTMTIGAIVPTLDSTIFARVLQAMQLQLSRHGYQLLVASHESSPQAEVEAIRTFLSRGVDGLMLVGAERSLAASRLLAATNIPVVLTWCGAEPALAVTVDNAKAGQLAAEHLVELGHRRIGMIVGHLDFNDRQSARLAGARAALARHGIEMPDFLVSQQSLSLAGGRAGCATLMQLDPPPSAIIGGIDLMAIGSLQEMQARGLTVPDDLSVVGIDDIDMSAHLTPALTTIHIPTTRIGTEAASRLVALISGKGLSGSINLPIELVVRHSASAPKIRASGSNGT